MASQKNYTKEQLADYKKRFDNMEKNHPYLIDFLNTIHKKTEETLKDHPEKKVVYNEAFDEKTLSQMYDEAWTFLKMHIKREKDKWEDQQFKKKNRKELGKIKGYFKEQAEPGFEFNNDE